MTFKQEIKKIIFDKIALLFVLSIPTYFLNSTLENNRDYNSFNSELNKIRVIKIAKVWEMASTYERKFYKLYDEIEKEESLLFLSKKSVNSSNKEKEIHKKKNVKIHLNNLIKAREDFFTIINRNKFYLTPPLESQVYEFYRSLAFLDLYQKAELSGIIGSNEVSHIKKAKERVDKYRANMVQIKKYIYGQ